MCMILVFAIGEFCWSILAVGVTLMSLWPLIIVGNLGVLSCLDVV
jgi:hypothetical protein